ncbi:uncharacterized protein LOC117817554 [Notolabrus celidotus]|uniref:uncharacterized protein LOC117817554 n=1 Tax=Notolabrus celidotus TaxID=1203425 RepID=UPI0014904793|nr:uncharacterized protein LOC117817554 [Notolabrus celidotus]
MRIAPYFVFVYVAMSFAVSDSELGSLSSAEDGGFVPVTQAPAVAAASGRGTARRRTRSSARVSVQQLADWPVHRILGELYSRDVSVPSGLSHGELYDYLSFQNSSSVVPQSVPFVAPSGGKRQAKKRHSQPVAPGAPAKRAGPPGPGPSADSSLASALLEMRSALTAMNARLDSMEGNAMSRVLPPSMPVPSSSVFAPVPAPLPYDVTPLRTLGTAVPAPSAGSSFLPPAAAIPDALRNQILAGHDINLVKILLCSTETADKRFVDCGEFSVILKDSDPRLSKTLTLAEFNVAFGVFRDTLCEVYPLRRAELDTYLAIISDLALSYGGSLFYEYHKSFSAKAALSIQKFNQRVDWSVVDLGLISRHFTGHKTLACTVCGSFSHTTSLCPRTALQRLSTSRPLSRPDAPASSSGFRPKRQVQTFRGSTPHLCMNFNESVCTYPNCRFLHACSWCGDSHPRSVCPRRPRPAHSGK